MATKPEKEAWMGRRTVRVDDATWADYLAACERENVNASEALRKFMRRYTRKRTTV